MDRDFDCRLMLVDIQTLLSDEARCLLHFIIGNNVPRRSRDDLTLGGTLKIIESLFEQEKISQDNLELLIKAFDAVQCRTAARRLREFQSPRQQHGEQTLMSTAPLLPTISDDQIIKEHRSLNSKPREKESLFTKIFDDIDDEDDKGPTKVFEPLFPTDESSSSPGKTVPFSISSETDDIIDKPQTCIKSKLLQKQIFKSPLTLCLSVVFLLNSLALIAYLLFLTGKKNHSNAYLIKNEKTNNTNNEWFNHAQNLSLTYSNQLTSIKFYRLQRSLCSIEFIYSPKKAIKHVLKRNCTPNTESILNFDQKITHIIQYFKSEPDKSTYINDISFCVNKAPCGIAELSDASVSKASADDNIFGYALAESTAYYIKIFQFVWYKPCPIDQEIQDNMITADDGLDY